MTKPSYPAYYLNLGRTHQLSGLRRLVNWPADVEMDEDGCLLFHDQPSPVDGWEPDPVDPNVMLPVADECVERIHSLHFEDGKPRLEAFCMLPGCGHWKQAVSMATCSACPLRRGRE